MTTKGELVRAILFPPPHDFKFFSDFLKSVYVFLVLGLIGMAYSLTMWIRNGVSWVKYGVRSPKFIWAPVYSCTHWLRPRNSPPPPTFGLIYEGAIGLPR